MPCIVALIVLAILSLFSAKYRVAAREAFDCVFRRVTLRPCNTGFDVRFKSSILSKLIVKSPGLTRFVNQRFELISWVMVLSFFVSLVWTGRGIYLFWTTGNCNGLNQGGFCAFDPKGANNAVSGTAVECRTGGAATGDLTLNQVRLDSFFSEAGNNSASLVFIGCYACKYSRQTYPLIKSLVSMYRPAVKWVFYPTHPEAEYLLPYDYCVQQHYPNSYLTWVDALYTEPMESVASEAATLNLLSRLGMDSNTVAQCVADPASQQESRERRYEIDKTGIYGTPTVFLNETPVVGPKPFRVYRRLLNRQWF